MGSMSIMHWVIVLLIVVMVFGTKKISGMGGDLGKAIKGFKDGVNGIEEDATKLKNDVEKPVVAEKKLIANEVVHHHDTKQ